MPCADPALSESKASLCWKLCSHATLSKQHGPVSSQTRRGVCTLAFLRSLPNMSFKRGTGAFCPSTLSHSSRQSPKFMQPA